MNPAAVGSWAWGRDIVTFRPDGTGTYWRGGAVCYEFTYTIVGDVITKYADRDHSCGTGRVFPFRFRRDGDALEFTHVSSGFSSRWERVGDPG